MRRTIPALLFFLIPFGNAFASPDANEILASVEKHYGELKSFVVQGTVTSDVSMGFGKAITRHEFQMKLGRPQQYLITWSHTTEGKPEKNRGAVWKGKSTPHLYQSFNNEFLVFDRDEMALAAATGVSGGVAHTLPSAFFGNDNLFRWIRNAKMLKTETIDGQNCYVIRGDSKISKEHTLWISKDKLFLLKHVQSYEKPKENAATLPELTDDQIKATLKSTGSEVTDEKIKQMRMMMKNAQVFSKMEMAGTKTELFTHIQADLPFQPSDFEFQIPAGATQGKRLFGDFPRSASKESKEANLPATETPTLTNPLDTKLAQAYKAKLSNPAYEQWMSSSSFPTGYQAFPEEAKIKEIISEMSAKVTSPKGAKLNSIPVVQVTLPTIDGRLSPGEWTHALRMQIGSNQQNSPLLLESDGQRLYIASDAFGDKTAEGFDQLRFHYHVNISPLIANERIHVDDRGYLVIRQTNVKWEGAPPIGDGERWKKFPISESNVHKLALGSSRMDGHRRYEAQIDLKEAGLHVGTPFASFVEVETDPINDGKGKFRSRAYVGRLGSQEAPVWFVIK